MIQVGDMVRLLDSSCSCHFCEEAQEDYHEVVSNIGSHIRVKLHSGGVDFPIDWAFDVQNSVQENE
jgi:hypothetical protein